MHMHTRYCPHCGSQNIFKVTERKTEMRHEYTEDEIEEIEITHYHECGDCQEHWGHHL